MKTAKVHILQLYIKCPECDMGQWSDYNGEFFIVYDVSGTSFACECVECGAKYKLTKPIINHLKKLKQLMREQNEQ